jgi:hypothetical protein
MENKHRTWCAFSLVTTMAAIVGPRSLIMTERKNEPFFASAPCFQLRSRRSGKKISFWPANEKRAFDFCREMRVCVFYVLADGECNFSLSKKGEWDETRGSFETTRVYKIILIKLHVSVMRCDISLKVACCGKVWLQSAVLGKRSRETRWLAFWWIEMHRRVHFMTYIAVLNWKFYYCAIFLRKLLHLSRHNHFHFFMSSAI